MSYPARTPKKGRPGAFFIVVWLAILTIAALVIGNTVFAIRSISVEGNSTVSDDEVIRAAGISLGTSIFSIDAQAVEDGVNGNRYLNFIGFWRDFPSHVILRVQEHSPHAKFTWMGMLYMLDAEGTVLEQTSHMDIPLTVPTITGLAVEVARVGSSIVSGMAGQTDAVAEVLTALAERDLTDGISELNVASLDNLYLITVDGAKVRLGNAQNLDRKLYLMEQALLIEREIAPVRYGVLDVTTAVNADYRPPTLEPEAEEPEDAAIIAQEGTGQEATADET